MTGCGATSTSTSVAEVADLITPVPGGVGPMTIAMLMRNTLRSALLQGYDAGEPEPVAAASAPDVARVLPTRALAAYMRHLLSGPARAMRLR